MLNNYGLFLSERQIILPAFTGCYAGLVRKLVFLPQNPTLSQTQSCCMTATCHVLLEVSNFVNIFTYDLL